MLFFAGLIACLLAEKTQAKISANNKLYHERSGSQIEDVFRKLPSIENEVDSLFDDASFLSSFGPSPSADKQSENEIDDLFRRILASEDNAKNRKLSFLGDNLSAAGISSSNLNNAEGEDGAEPTKFSDFMNNMSFKQLEEGPTASSVSSISSVEPVVAGRPVGPFGTAPTSGASLTSNSLSSGYSFQFPSIQHTVFSGPIHLKAHSNTDLSPLDPEIFEVLESILTPYLEQTIGESLHAYNLEIDYSPSVEEGVDKDSVVTLMETKCIFKVISDSIESLRSTNHELANKWIVDFFTGPERYNMNKLIEALQQNGIPVDDIVFVNQTFKMDDIVVSESNTQSFGNKISPKKIAEKLPSGTAMVAVTLSVLFAGILFFMHYTGRLPSKAQTRNSLRKFKRNKKEGRGRTFSGTFRRHPTGGIRKAKIQKQPAKSEQYLGDSESASNKHSAYGDDYSFSKYGGDYGPSTPSRQSSAPPMTPHSRRTEKSEFSMPSNYDSGHERGGMLGKWAAWKKSNQATKSPIPTGAPRRVTADDIASVDDDEDWSIDSYESSVESPSDHKQLYRDFNGDGTEMRRPVPPSDPPASNHRREKLSLPFFN